MRRRRSVIAAAYSCATPARSRCCGSWSRASASRTSARSPTLSREPRADTWASRKRPPAPDGAPVRLGVNVDHVATVRQARGVDYPDPVEAALSAERAGADGITVHLREDRRHIQDHDVERLRRALRVKLNLEMAVTDAMVDFALRVRPDDACFVPERREEITTEGGLDVVRHPERVAAASARLQAAGIRVSL